MIHQHWMCEEKTVKWGIKNFSIVVCEATHLMDKPRHARNAYSRKHPAEYEHSM